MTELIFQLFKNLPIQEAILANLTFGEVVNLRDALKLPDLSFSGPIEDVDDRILFLEGVTDLTSAVYRLVSEEGSEKALLVASENNNLEMIQFLVQKGAEFNSTKNKTPLKWAVINSNFEMVKFLLDQKQDPNIKTSIKKETVIWKAILLKDFRITKLLIERGAQLTFQNHYGSTILMNVIPRISLNRIKFLLDQKVDPNIVNKIGQSALSIAAGFNDFKLMRLLLKYNANIDLPSIDGSTILMEAAEKRNLKMVEFCVKNSANLNAVDSEGRTALMLAAENDHLQIVNFLMEKGADPTITTSKGETAWSLASQKYHFKIIRYLQVHSNLRTKTS